MARSRLHLAAGSVIVEFCLVLPIFIALLLFAIKIGMFFYTRDAMLFAAETTARRVSVTTVPFAVEPFVHTLLNNAGVDSTQIQVQWKVGGVPVTEATAFAEPPGTLLAFTVQHLPASWLDLTTGGKHAIQVVMRKEGAVC